MVSAALKTGPAHYLSLRWKSLIALGIALAIVNASLAFVANLQLVNQFELQQSAVRDQQARQLQALVDERNLEMSKLASLVLLLGNGERDADIGEQLRRALTTHGTILDVEWDIRSVHWVGPDGLTRISWPPDTPDIPETLSRQLSQAPEGSIAALSCSAECRQYLATPVLSDGSYGGSIVLGRSLADSLLSFKAMTGAEVAIAPTNEAATSAFVDPDSPSYLQFPAVTYPDKTIPILRIATRSTPELATAIGTTSVQYHNDWFEIFRARSIAPDVDALVVNDISAQRAAIRAGTTGSILLGLAGLALSIGLLLVIMRSPLRRLRDLASALPLLAENRYTDLRARLPLRERQLALEDEFDLMTNTVSALTDRMESLQYDREQAESRLLWLANHDPLTQLFNRRRFNDDLRAILERAMRFGHKGALLFFDLDQFKDVNDLSGHQVGDSLLQRVAEQLRLTTQPSDLLARLGGDEFALVLPEGTEEDARASAERLQGAISSIILQEHDRRHRVSASIGIAMFPDQGTSVDQLMANADLAMYQAKEKGRGRWYFYSDEDQGKAQLDARVLWRDEIAQALQLGRFELHFQPIIEIASGEVSHMEVLLRMRNSRGEMVYPDRFIPIAERTGQIDAIDRWVVDRALATLQREPQLQLSINLSASAMDDPTLLDDLRERLAHYAVAPQRVTFEVTETAAINSLMNATRLMRGMQSLGCRFSLDDFGSGYASYAYLRKLPVDNVKIDGSFVRDLAENRDDQIFVKAMTDMVHGMGKQVTAEYVESIEVLMLLKKMGVDYAQGYYFGRPMPLKFAQQAAVG